LIEQFKPSVVAIVGIAFDARNLEADLVELCGVARNVGQHRDRALHEFGAFDGRVCHCAHFGLERGYLEEDDSLSPPAYIGRQNHPSK
jgi:hypothetical protein